jgi:RNA-splicing ligase RtcB
MITLKGKYNFANVMIDEIDDATRNQIQEFLNHPAFANTYISIMPDTHCGKGAVIGFTMKQNNYVIPNIIGVDIGCGMLMGKYDVKNIDLTSLDNYIKKNIPSGFHINSTVSASSNLISSVETICKTIGIDSEKALKAVGSLGGGNHFIEAGIDKDEKLVITIHSGSRNFGKCVAEFYQKKAKENLTKYFIEDQYKNLEFLPIDHVDAQAYLFSMNIAQQFASENRMEMLNRISNHLGMSPINVIESVHNFIGDDGIIRKGATSANLNQRVIIPFNMKDGIAVCIGKGSEKYNMSAPHGSGRILSRTKAKLILNVEDFQNEMKTAGVFTTTANKDTLDEAPGAYKPMDLILENIKETVDVVELIKPIYNFKAGGD